MKSAKQLLVRTLAPRVAAGLLMMTCLGLFQPAPADAASILFVLRDDIAGVLPVGDQAVFDRLTNDLGHTVTVREGTASQPSDAAGMDLVLVSSTLLSGSVNTKFTDQNPTFSAMQIPTIQWEQALNDEFLISNGGGELGGQDTVTITPEGAAHRLSAGLGEGDVLVRNSATVFHMQSNTNLAPDAIVIARGSDDQPAITLVEQGGLLNNNTTTASARRISVFFADEGINDFTDAGLRLFDAAVNYALNITPGEVAGDVNNDMVVDLLDYEIIRDNFGVGTTREEGNLDFRGVTDLADFRLWKDAFQAAGGSPPAAVPEPHGAVLAVLAGLGLIGVVRRRGTAERRNR